MLLAPASSAGLVLAGLAALARAAVTPNTPGTANVGSACTITWLLDHTKGSKWTSFDIDLRTGNDFIMNTVKRVASKLDGTTGNGSYTYPCPTVTPNAPIYFYQFTVDDKDPQWTGRFTIASATGATTAAQYSTQPNGAAKPWGIGKLSKLNATTTNSTASAATTGTGSASAAMDDVASPTSTGSATDPDATATDGSDSSTATTDAATATAAAATTKSKSSYAGPLASLATVPRILVWVGIGVVGALLLGLLSWAICCCRRKSAAQRDARESTFGDGAFSAAAAGGAAKLPIRHPSHIGTTRGGYGEMARGVDRKLTVDTARAGWDNGLASARSPFADEKRGRAAADGRYEMHAPLGSPEASFARPSDGHGRPVETPPPGWTAPQHYGTGASHSAISVQDEGRPLVPAFANGQRGEPREELRRQPSAGLGMLAGRSYQAAQEARYTQFNMAGHAYEEEGRAWASEKSPTTPVGREPGWI